MLLQIKSYFKEVGNIYTYKNAIIYRVFNLSDIINIIITNFDKYPLVIQKQNDYIMFKNIVELMNKGEHLNKDGIIKIVNFRASLNKGLSEKLKISFPNAIKIERPNINPPINIDPN